VPVPTSQSANSAAPGVRRFTLAPMASSRSELNVRRPRSLRPGSRVAVVAPSSGLLAASALDRGVRALERLELEVVVGAAVREIRGYLAGEDGRRAEDLLWALSDRSIDAVWCARGGYGAARTVAALDGLRAALFAAAPFEVAARPDDDWVTTLVPGQADGVLAGGVLPRLAALVGTPLQVDFAGKVCFFEDVNESVMGVDEHLTQVIAAGCFDGCVGIAIGDHIDVTARGETSLGLEQVFADLLTPLGIPCCFYLPIGHGPYQATLPIGARVHFDADEGTLRVLEPAVI